MTKTLDMLLINPPLADFDQQRILKINNGSYSMQPPLGLAYIAAYLEQSGYRVRILDMDMLKTTLSQLGDYFKRYNILSVGIGSTTLAYRNTLKILKLIKSFNKEIFTILGGFHPTLFPEAVIQEEDVDFVVVGEGEYTTKELLDVLLRKNNSSNLEEVKGILYKDIKNHGKIKRTPPRPAEKDLDKFPFPARHLFLEKANELYFSAIAIQNPTTSLITERGCPFQCTFCSKIWKTARFRSYKNVLEEIEEISDRYGIKDIQIIDSEFNLHKKASKKLCDEIIRNKIDVHWRAVCRVDFIDEEAIIKYKRAGMYVLSLGAESGSDRILKFLKKGYNTSQIRSAFKLADKYELETHGMFMLGIPGETTRDLWKTIRFIRELAPTYLQLTIYTPVKGTEIYSLLVKKKIIKDDIDISNCWGFQTPILNLKNLSNKTISNLRRLARVLSFLNWPWIIKTSKTIILNPLRFPKNIGWILKYSTR
ncbi:MAG: B12-binding domain-containing radical SAM protein [Promethearchaeota archaeon]